MMFSNHARTVECAHGKQPLEYCHPCDCTHHHDSRAYCHICDYPTDPEAVRRLAEYHRNADDILGLPRPGIGPLDHLSVSSFAQRFPDDDA